MTLSPFVSRQVKPRPDLPRYELNPVCAAPLCPLESTDNHHVLNRGMGWPRKSDYWWSELPSGEVVPVRLGVCRQHHHELTVHESKLLWELGGFAWYERTRDEWWKVGEVDLPVLPRFERVLPYMCEAHGQQRFRTCDQCLGECVPTGESVNARLDRLAAEGRA